MGTLLGYEVKKILWKKSTLVVFFILFIFHIVFVCISGGLGSTYVNDEFYETHAERNRIDRENGLSLSGRKIDAGLLKEMQEAYAKIDWSTQEYMWTDTYKNEVRKFSDLENRFQYWGLGSDFIHKGTSKETAPETQPEDIENAADETQPEDIENAADEMQPENIENAADETQPEDIENAADETQPEDIEKVTYKMQPEDMEAVIYQTRENYQNSMWKNYALSEAETAYWKEKEEAVEIPFTYEYAFAYESMLGGQGIYMMCMLLTFFTAISMVGVFTDEHSRKTDQLILCARYGRGKIYLAKILAGSLVVFVVNLLFIVTAFAGKFYSYGSEGFDTMIQVVSVFWYPYSMSAGEAVMISMGILLLSSVMVAVFTMLLAEVFKHSVGAMAVVVGLLFGARLVVIPPSWGILSQLWSYLPINMLKIDEGFTDLRLVNLFGIQLTTWQFAPVLYVVLTAAMVWGGSRIYKNYQVSGR